MYRKDICNRLIALFLDLEGVYSGKDMDKEIDQSKFKLTLLPKQNGVKFICKIEMECGTEVTLNEYGAGIVYEINRNICNLITTVEDFKKGNLYLNTVADFAKSEVERANDKLKLYKSFDLKLIYQPVVNSHGMDFDTETLVTVKTRLGEWEFLI